MYITILYFQHQNIFEELLNLCINELLFITPGGKNYKQLNCLAKMYMGNLEN